MQMANEEDAAKISEEVSGLRAELAKFAETVGEFIRTRGQDAAAKIQGTAEETWIEAKEKLDCVKKKIHDEPVAATAVAFGIGLLIGLIFASRRRR
jgi:ElaB/YqjD/DUF883 family membrane-anchored ribosome-binding protein